MHTAITIAGVLGSAWLLSGLAAPYWVWVLASGGALAGATVTSSAAPLGAPLLVLWSLYGLAAALMIPPIRRALVASPALNAIRNLLPPVSNTEREALEAGTVWFDADLFSGAPRWDHFLSEPAPSLSPEERAFLEGPTEELCGMLDDWRITHELRDLPEAVWSFIKTRGFLGMIIPKEHGGLGFSAQGHSAIVHKISTRSSTAAISVMVPNSLGPAELLLHYGTEAQRARYLPRLAGGEEIPSFALTSPAAGSDAAAMPDRGVVCRGRWKGQDDVLGLRVTWDKRYITLAPITTLLGLAFRAVDPDGLLGRGEDLGITLALVPADLPGVDVGRRHDVSKQAMLNGPTRGEDVFIAMEQIVGGEERIGQGWRMLMDCLSAGRSVSLPATSAAATKFCARNTGAYARVRKQFKTPIGKFEGVEEKLANIAGQSYALEAARGITAASVDAGEKPSVISALLKYESTERMRSVVNDAMDIHGGRAICEGPSNYLSNAYQFVPVSITVEGANILTRTLIVFGQGAIRCHPWLLKEMEAAAETDRGAAVRAMDRALGGHIRHVLANLSRATFHNLTGGRFASAPSAASAETRHWYRQLTRASASFAIAADFAFLSLGGALKRKEKLSGRFADALAELYLSSCVLKRFEDDGRPPADQALVHWYLRRALCRIQDALQGVLQNLPARPLAWALRLALFPLGGRRQPPSDSMGQRVARILLEPSEARDRLCRGTYVSMDKDDPTGRLEHAMRASIEAEPYERRLRKGDELNDNEMSIVRAAREAEAFAIAVDDFGEDEFGGAPWRRQRRREETTA